MNDLAERLESCITASGGIDLRDPNLLRQAAQALRGMGEARDELKRLRDAKWSDLSDADLGRCFKAFAAQVEETAQKDYSGDAEMRLGLMQMGLMQAIKMAAESNAEAFTYTASGFHSEGKQLGDWSVTVVRSALKGRDGLE